MLRDLFADEHENGVWLEDPAPAERARHEEAHRDRRRARDPLEVGRGRAGISTGPRSHVTGVSSRSRLSQPTKRPPRSRSSAPVTTSSPPSTTTSGPRRWSPRPRASRRASTRSRPRSRPAPRSGARISGSPAASPASGATARSRSSRASSGPRTCRRSPPPTAVTPQDAGAATTDGGTATGRVDVPCDLDSARLAGRPPRQGPPGSRRRHRALRRSACRPHRAHQGASGAGLRGRVRPHGVPARARRVRPRLHRLVPRPRHRVQRDCRPAHHADERRGLRRLEPRRGDA